MRFSWLKFTQSDRYTITDLLLFQNILLESFHHPAVSSIPEKCFGLKSERSKKTFPWTIMQSLEWLISLIFKFNLQNIGMLTIQCVAVNILRLDLFKNFQCGLKMSATNSLFCRLTYFRIMKRWNKKKDSCVASHSFFTFNAL